MDTDANDSLAGTLRAMVGGLEQAQMAYLVIGGIAQAVLGEPRTTQDVDCIVAIQPSDIVWLFDALQAAGFTVNRTEAQQRVEMFGTFRVTRGHWRVDVIVASTEFERSAFARSQRLRLYGMELNLPTPEDFIILKLVPGRDKDLLDAKIVFARHRQRLNLDYMKQWAQRLSDEAEDIRIWQLYQRLITASDES